MHRLRMTVTAVPAMLVAALATAAPAAALDVVEVQRHDAGATTLRLIGASASAFAVEQGQPERRFLLGATGTRLSPRAADVPVEPLPSVDGVAGYLTYDGSSAPLPSRLHLLTLATGAETVVDHDDDPMAITGDGWIGRGEDGVLRRHVVGTPGAAEYGGAGTVTEVAADRTGMLVVRAVTALGRTSYALDLVTFATGAVRRVVTSTAALSRPALSSSTIAWVSDAASENVLVQRRARTGGAITGFRETNELTAYRLAVAGDRVGWAFSDSTGAWLRVLTGASARRVALPGTGSGVMGVADRLIVSVSGRLAGAGVYSVGGGAAVRLATVPPERARFRSITLSAGGLGYTDDAIADGRGLPIWQAPVTGSAVPQIGTPRLLPARANERQPVAFSAGRGLAAEPATGRFRLLDRGVAGRSIRYVTSEYGEIDLSGPYAMIDQTLYGPTGAALLRPWQLGAVGADHYGSLVAYAARGDVWVLDVAKPRSTANPRRLTTGCGDCGWQIAIWGTTVAWSRPDGSFAVGTIGSDAVRAVSGAGTLHSLRLGEGTLAWGESTDTGITEYVLDLRTPDAEPVALTGYRLIELDDHRFLARRSSALDVVVGRLPFHAPYAPRLIATIAATRFKPGGDGRADVWAPQFDTTKPLTGVALRIRGPGGRTIRTLTGTGPDGSIRDLRWDGRTGSGRPAPAGRYTWQLVARAADGEGTLTAANGVRPVTGVLVLSR